MKVGILGGGQLARMMAASGIPLGMEFVFVDPAADACAGAYGPLLTAEWKQAPALEGLRGCDRITCDFENVPAEVLDALGEIAPVRPGPEAFAAAQDRLTEKRLFQQLDIPVPPFAEVSSRADLLEAVDVIGLPAVLKTRRFGYDGKGQAVLRSREDMEPAWRELGGHDLILEGWINFQHECAVTAVRGSDGSIASYPLSWTVHADGILRLALAPAPVAPDLESRARELVGRLLAELNYVGCLTLELFATDQGLIANEFAPRVHNSAHWTIDGSVTSQFENHLRAVCDLPLGSTAMRGQALMLNWIGQMPPMADFLGIPGLRWHDYGKSARPGRKVGHATLVAEDRQSLQAGLASIVESVDAQTASLLNGEMTPLG
jgi:5-(carboxyamino)imidazole ribonucleotide synthase